MNAVLLGPCLEPGDATGHDILQMQDVLQRNGHAVQIMVAENRTRQKTCRPQAALLKKADLIIYHFSIHWPQALELLPQATGKILVRYHNITPGDFFRPYQPDIARNCDLARLSLATIARQADFVLANSAYSATEFLEHSFAAEHLATLPPLSAIDQLIATEADEATLKKYLQTYPESVANFLCVGRIAPNKNHRAMIEAFARYHALHRNSRLIIAGKLDPALKPYSNELRALIRSEHLEKAVVFTGSVSLAELKALYLSATALLALSLHEGFCVPVVEAMALMVPVLSSGRTALAQFAETALGLDSLEPAFIAAAMEKIQEDDFRHELLRAGLVAYTQHYSANRLEERFLAQLQEWQLC